MKRFFAIFAAWLVVLCLAVFFLGSWMFEGNGHWLRPILPLALLLTGFCLAIAELSDEVEELKKRLDALEQLSGGKTSGPQPSQGQPPVQE